MFVKPLLNMALLFSLCLNKVSSSLSLSPSRALHVLVREDDARPVVPAKDACVRLVAGRARGLWGTDDGDADAMATGRLDPDLYINAHLFI